MKRDDYIKQFNSPEKIQVFTQGRDYCAGALLNINGFAVHPDAADIIASGVIDNFLQSVFRRVFSRIDINIASGGPGILPPAERGMERQVVREYARLYVG